MKKTEDVRSCIECSTEILTSIYIFCFAGSNYSIYSQLYSDYGMCKTVVLIYNQTGTIYIQSTDVNYSV